MKPFVVFAVCMLALLVPSLAEEAAKESDYAVEAASSARKARGVGLGGVGLVGGIGLVGGGLGGGK